MNFTLESDSIFAKVSPNNLKKNSWKAQVSIFDVVICTYFEDSEEEAKKQVAKTLLELKKDINGLV